MIEDLDNKENILRDLHDKEIDNKQCQHYEDLSSTCQKTTTLCVDAPIDVINNVTLSSTSSLSTRSSLSSARYTPSLQSRISHNEKERARRSRMKFSCDMLRGLVPGVSDKTDKATVLEHTVQYLLHLQQCVGIKCGGFTLKSRQHQHQQHDCDQHCLQESQNENIKSQMKYDYSTTTEDDDYNKYHQFNGIGDGNNTYDGQYQAQEQLLGQFEDTYEQKCEIERSIEEEEEMQVIEVHESQLITAPDGLQYMIIDNSNCMNNNYNPATNATITSTCTTPSSTSK